VVRNVLIAVLAWLAIWNCRALTPLSAGSSHRTHKGNSQLHARRAPIAPPLAKGRTHQATHRATGQQHTTQAIRHYDFTPRTYTPSESRDRAVKQVMREMVEQVLKADRVLRGAARNLEYRRKSQLGLHAIIANIKSEVLRRVLPEKAPTNILLLVIINTIHTQQMSSAPITAATALPPSLGTATPLTMTAQSRKWQQLNVVADIVMSWPKLQLPPLRYASGKIAPESRMTQQSLVTSLVARQSMLPRQSSAHASVSASMRFYASHPPLPAQRHGCTVCAAVFTSENALHSHYVNAHPDVNHMCSECGTVLTTYQTLATHMRHHHGGGSRKGGHGTSWHQGRWY
jgi:hypothetical protein